MTDLVPCDVEETLSDIERSVGGSRRIGTVLDPCVVDALDVVHHALEVSRHPRALVLWRQALYDGTVAPDAREAVRDMLTYLNEAVARDETDRLHEICDCLELFMRASDPA